jgi:hypothetical protein
MAWLVESRMSVDKDKVNTLLLEFQKLLQMYRPNNSELQLITSKITKMTQKNILKQERKKLKGQSRQEIRSSPTSAKKWHKIKID